MLSSTVKGNIIGPVKKSILVYKNSDEILDKLKARDFNATSLSTYEFSTL